MPALEKGNGDEDDNSLASVANLDLKNPGVSIRLLPSAHRLFRCAVYLGVWGLCAIASRLESVV